MNRSGNVAMTSIMSVNVRRMESTKPPLYPAMKPTMTPIAVENETEDIAPVAVGAEPVVATRVFEDAEGAGRKGIDVADRPPRQDVAEQRSRYEQKGNNDADAEFCAGAPELNQCHGEPPLP